MYSRTERRYRPESVFLRHKLAVTVHRRNLPNCDTVVDGKPNTASYITTPKVLAAAQRDIEIARERELTLEEVWSHDHHLTSHLFDGDFTSVTPDKIKLVGQLEVYLIDDIGVGIG